MGKRDGESTRDIRIEITARRSSCRSRYQQYAHETCRGTNPFPSGQSDERKTCLNPKLQTSRIASGDKALP